MSKQTINIGASPNDGTGTPLRTSFDYTNQNFTELYTALGGGVGLPGATTQVIFNDGGTNLAGDAGLVYNKTTDALTVAGLVTAGSATITGALTSGTTTLVSHAAGYTGKVGIGTATPNNTLTINGTAATWTKGAYIIYSDAGSTYIGGLGNGGNIFGSGTDNDIGITTGGATNLRLGTNNTERMRIDSSGNVGLGSTSPNSRLQIVGSTDDETVQSCIRFSRKGYESSAFGVSISASGGSVASQNNLVFNTSNGTNAPAERVRIDGNGNLSLANGNVVMTTSGKGIDFSATASGSGTMTSELLNDYEEGTFTPTIVGTTTAGTGTYVSRTGRYTKIGNQVTVWIYFNWTAHTGTGDMSVDGLPFTIENLSGNYPAPSFGLIENIALTAGKYLGGYGNLNSTKIILLQYPTGGGAIATVPIDSAAEFSLTMTYRV